MRRIAFASIGLVLGGAFYMLTIDSISLPELYVLAGVALLAAIAFEVSREQRFVEAALRPGWLRRSWLVLLRVPRDVALVSWEAFIQVVQRRPARGKFRAVEFRAGGDRASDNAGRRALAEALGSLTPNTIVVGVDRERDLVLVHQLRRRGGRGELDPLELG